MSKLVEYLKDFNNLNGTNIVVDSKIITDMLNQHNVSDDAGMFFSLFDSNFDFALFCFFRERVKQIEVVVDLFNSNTKTYKRKSKMSDIVHRGYIYELNKEFKECILGATYFKAKSASKVLTGDIDFDHHKFLNKKPFIEVRKNGGDVPFAKFIYIFSDIMRHESEFTYRTSVGIDKEYSSRIDSLNSRYKSVNNKLSNKNIPDECREKIVKDSEEARKRDYQQFSDKYCSYVFAESPSFKFFFESLGIDLTSSVSRWVYLDSFKSSVELFDFQVLFKEWIIGIFEDETGRKLY